MKIQNCKRKQVDKTKNKVMQLSIRITKELSEWLRKNELSPTGVFDEAVKELGYKEVKEVKEKK